MSNTLLPCPFCGGNDIQIDEMESFWDKNETSWRVLCIDCIAETAGDTKEQAIAAWNRRADHLPDATKMVSNADRIRSMSDEELAVWILRSVDCDKENIMCIPALYKNSDKCDGRCRDGRLFWLKQPVKEEHYEDD